MVQTCSIYSLFFIIIIIDSILKSGDIALPTKVHLVKAMVFPVVMYGWGSWTIKKAERWRIDAFELLCWRRLLKSPLDCREIQPVLPKGNQSWIFIRRTDAEANTLATWCKELTHWKRLQCWEKLKVGEGTAVDKMVGWHHRLNGHEFEQALGVGDREAWRTAALGVAKSQTEWLDWTDTSYINRTIPCYSVFLKSSGRKK